MLKRMVFAIVCCAALLSCGPQKEGDQGVQKIDPSRLEPFGEYLKYDPKIPVNDGEPITLTFWTQLDQEAVYKALFKDYSAIHPNVTVEVLSSTFSEHFNKLQIALASGLGPDFFHVHNSFSDALIPHMEPYPEDILPYSQLKKDFRQVASHSINGNIYFIDTGIMTSCILYNKKYWADAGLTDKDYPKSWDELKRVARKLTRFDATGRMVRAGFNPNGIAWSLFMAMNLQKGQRLFRAYDGKTPLIDTPKSRDTLDYILDFYNGSRVTDRRLSWYNDSFSKGQSAMIYAWGWVVNFVRTYNPNIPFASFPLPTWDGRVPPAYDRNNGESSMGVNRYSDKRKQRVAFDIIKFFLASDQYLLDLDIRFCIAPSKRTLDSNDTIKNNEFIQTFTKTFDRTVWAGPFPGEFEDYPRDYLMDPIVLDNVSIDKAIADTERLLTQKMKQSSFVSQENQYAFIREFGN